MHQNHIYADINEGLPDLCGRLLEYGEENGSRNGAVKEFTHIGTTLLHPLRREILLDDRKANIAAQIAETMWVLAGRDDVAWLRRYLPRADDFSDDGERWRGAYGPRLRAYPRGREEEPVDQWAHCLDLLRADPLTRRAAMVIYDPVVDTEPGLDIPCNNWITFSSRLGRLDLHVGIRSNDLIWGWSGINAFEWSALLEISAALLGIRPGALHFSTTSLHLYAPHWAKAQRMADVAGNHFGELEDSPRFVLPTGMSLAGVDGLIDQWFVGEAIIREHGAEAAAHWVDGFPEPMLQSWLRVLQWWWSGDHKWLEPIGRTRLEYATHVSVQPKREPEPTVQAVVGAIVQQVATGNYGPLDLTQQPPQHSAFLQHAMRTHVEKHAAYGDSWKKRGEMLGIMANVARKVDRLGGAETSDETSADTAMDLMVYLAKYRCWMFDQRNGTTHSDEPTWANDLLRTVEDRLAKDTRPVPHRAGLEEYLRNRFDALEFQVTEKRDKDKAHTVDDMLATAYTLARTLWEGTAHDEPLFEDDYRGADAD